MKKNTGINKSEVLCLHEFNNSKTFIEYSNEMDDVYEDIDEFIIN